MMTWSIMFHSWLAFVFLMWSNVVWLCPDQRSFMLKTSPLLVIYAMLLLAAQYIYGMDLTEQELPSNITVSWRKSWSIVALRFGHTCYFILKIVFSHLISCCKS